MRLDDDALIKSRWSLNVMSLLMLDVEAGWKLLNSSVRASVQSSIEAP